MEFSLNVYAAQSGIVFLQNQQDGAQPIALFNSLDKSVEFSVT